MANDMLLSLGEVLRGTKENYEEVAKNFLDTFTIRPDDAQVLNDIIQRRDPSYQPPSAEEQERRRKLAIIAKQKITATLINAAKPVVENEGATRELATILIPGEGHQQENQQILHAVTKGTPEEKLEFVRQQMERMGSIDTGKLTEYSDEQIVERFDGLFPILHMGAEFQKFRSVLEGCSEEERADFEVLKDRMCDGFDYLSRRINNIINPLYPSVDMQSLDYGEPNLMDDLSGFIFGNPSPSEGALVMAKNMFAWINGRKTAMGRVIGTDDGTMTFSVSPDMEEGTDYISALRNGQTVYGKPTGSNEAPKLYRVFNEKVLKELPAPVKEPGSVTRLFDGIARFLGFKGFQSCRDYESYQQEMQRIEEEALREDPDPEYTRTRQRVAKRKADREKETTVRKDLIRSSERSLEQYKGKTDAELTVSEKIQKDAHSSMIEIHQAVLDGKELTPEEKENHLLNVFVSSMKSEITQEKQVSDLKNLMKGQEEFKNLMNKNSAETSGLLANHQKFRDVKQRLMEEMQRTVKKPEQVNAPQEERKIEKENSMEVG